ncbi:MAG: acylphosphatase [Flavobacteriales bacterium]
MERLHLDLSITGHVQGVWYRKTAVEQAITLGLKGYAKNLPDGSVHIEAEGSQEALDAFISWCRNGPPLARVARVTSAVGKWVGYIAFETRR